MKKAIRPKVAFLTLGCKLNQAESEQLSYQFAERGYDVSGGGPADIFVINTCTVTHIADRKARHLVRFTRKNNPGAFIAVIGCAAEKDREAYETLGASLITGNTDKTRLPELIGQAIKDSVIRPEKPVEAAVGERIRSFVKIQDGCRHFCTYCIVPFVRSRDYSVSEDEIISLIRQRIGLGYQEVVLTGTEIGRYRHGETGLDKLVKRILAETAVRRLHLSSLQPAEINSALIALWADSRLMPHFHIALQSGSDAVLKRMNRAYDTVLYRRSLELIRQSVENASLTTDIMVGFPGETDAEFEQSYRFCKEMRFAALHVFSYSRRPGTVAAELPGQISDKIKKERSLRMLALARESSANFRLKFTGTETEVLFENEEKNGSGISSGFSCNYVRVYARRDEPLANMILPVKLVSPYRNGLMGELL